MSKQTGRNFDVGVSAFHDVEAFGAFPVDDRLVSFARYDRFELDPSVKRIELRFAHRGMQSELPIVNRDDELFGISGPLQKYRISLSAEAAAASSVLDVLDLSAVQHCEPTLLRDLLSCFTIMPRVLKLPSIAIDTRSEAELDNATATSHRADFLAAIAMCGERLEHLEVSGVNWQASASQDSSSAAAYAGAAGGGGRQAPRKARPVSGITKVAKPFFDLLRDKCPNLLVLRFFYCELDNTTTDALEALREFAASKNNDCATSTSSSSSSLPSATAATTTTNAKNGARLIEFVFPRVATTDTKLLCQIIRELGHSLRVLNISGLCNWLWSNADSLALLKQIAVSCSSLCSLVATQSTSWCGAEKEGGEEMRKQFGCLKILGAEGADQMLTAGLATEPSLRALALTDWFSSETSERKLIAIIRSCRKLESLSFQNKGGSCADVLTENVVAAIRESKLQLKHLQVAYATEISSQGNYHNAAIVQPICETLCGTLEGLHLQLVVTHEEHLFPLKSCTKLVKLLLDQPLSASGGGGGGQLGAFASGYMANQFVTASLDKWRRANSLSDPSALPQVDISQAILEISQHAAANLVFLRLRGATLNDEDKFQKAILSMPKLFELDLSGCSGVRCATVLQTMIAADVESAPKIVFGADSSALGKTSAVVSQPFLSMTASSKRFLDSDSSPPPLPKKSLCVADRAGSRFVTNGAWISMSNILDERLEYGFYCSTWTRDEIWSNRRAIWVVREMSKKENVKLALSMWRVIESACLYAF